MTSMRLLQSGLRARRRPLARGLVGLAQQLQQQQPQTAFLGTAAGRCSRGFSAAAPLSPCLSPEEAASARCFVWGSNQFGQLGIGSDQFRKLTPTEVQSPDGSGFRSVHCGPSHTAWISGNGALFTAGRRQFNKLGHGGAADGGVTLLNNYIAPFSAITAEAMGLVTRSVEGVALPEQVGDIDDVVEVCCSRFATHALTGDGTVYSWGYGGEKVGNLGFPAVGSYVVSPLEVSALKGKKIKSISAGKLHAAALTEDGKVYIWGDGEYGVQGGGSSTVLPKVMDFFVDQGLKVSRIQCGDTYTAAVASDGQLYVWGNNRHGQLGTRSTLQLDVTAFHQHPVPVDTLTENGAVPVDVACADRTMVTLAEDGRVFRSGQRTWNAPAQVEAANDRQEEFGSAHIVQVGAGKFAGAALSSDGRLFTFGLGKSAQLGNGDTQNSPGPRLVESLAEQGLEVLRVSMGHHAVAVLAKEKK